MYHHRIIDTRPSIHNTLVPLLIFNFLILQTDKISCSY